MPSPGSPGRASAPLERAAERRSDLVTVPDDALVLVVSGDRAPLDAAGDLWWLPATDPRVTGGEAVFAFLGIDESGRQRWVQAASAREVPFADPARWGMLREVSPLLSGQDADALVTAVSLARWLIDAPYCPACGNRTDLESAGWSRTCPACGRQHFPRTDPAIIVAVTDPDNEHLLLGSHAAWGEGRFSCFAGFVEAGESLETTIVREVAEEAGVSVTGIRYFGSQPWPYPRSLMVGFHVVADGGQARPDGEEIIDVRWFTRQQITDALAGAGEIALPGPASIARRLIESWARSPS